MSRVVAAGSSRDDRAFEGVVKAVRNGESVDDSELLPFLTTGSRDGRCTVNLRLTEAYLERYRKHRVSRDLERARACADRAWLLSGHAEEVLPVFTDVQRAAGDVVRIKQAWKEAGLERARRGDVGRALELFDASASADAAVAKVDRRTYDPEILACVERMAAIHRAALRPRRAREDGKLRIARLMHGLVEPGSVLTKIERTFARHHDRRRFEVAFFSTDGEGAVARSPDAREAIEDIRRFGWSAAVAPDTGSLYEDLLATGRRISAFEPDVLVTSAGLATFKNYFVVCLGAARVAISLHQGPSPQFTSHAFDHAISWFEHLMLDCPTECSHVELELDAPSKEHIRALPRADLGIPEDAVVVASGGRWPKFRDAGFWRAMADVLHADDSLYWLVLGLSQRHAEEAGAHFEPAVLERLRFRGWQVDYLGALASADLFVDSYPVGGGVLVRDAMALGLPVVSFEHDYVAPFDNTAASGGPEIVQIPELLIPRGDFRRLKDVVSRLARDAGYRREMGERCRVSIARRSDPARMVRRCEEIFERVFEDGSREARGASTPFPEDGPAGGPSVLLEQVHALNRREAELNRREARLYAPFRLLARARAAGWRRAAAVARDDLLHRARLIGRRVHR